MHTDPGKCLLDAPGAVCFSHNGPGAFLLGNRRNYNIMVQRHVSRGYKRRGENLKKSRIYMPSRENQNVVLPLPEVSFINTLQETYKVYRPP